jgi:hypothetical protein
MKYRMDVSMCQGNLGHKMWVCMDVKKRFPRWNLFCILVVLVVCCEPVSVPKFDIQPKIS